MRLVWPVISLFLIVSLIGIFSISESFAQESGTISFNDDVKQFLIVQDLTLIDPNSRKPVSTIAQGADLIVKVDIRNIHEHPQAFTAKFFWEHDDKKDLLVSITNSIYAQKSTFGFIGKFNSPADVKETYDIVVEIWDKEETTQIAQPFSRSFSIPESIVFEKHDTRLYIGDFVFPSLPGFILLLFYPALLITLGIVFGYYLVFSKKQNYNSSTVKTTLSRTNIDRFTIFTITITILFTISILFSMVPLWLNLPIFPDIATLTGLLLLPFMMFGGISGVGLYLIPIIVAYLWIIVFLRSRVK